MQELLSLLPVIGINSFEQIKQDDTANQHIYFLEVLECNAQGFLLNSGFAVCRGSRVRRTPVNAFEKHVPHYFAKRNQVIEDGIMVIDGDRYVFTQDYVFSSPSLDAAVCAGRSANGRSEWKDSDGKSLKNHQTEEAKED